MQIVQKYKANDGKVFNTEEECIKYEEILNQVDSIMKPLGTKVKDKDCVFGNGGGYIQHDKKVVKKAQEDIVKLAIKELKLEKGWKFGSFIGRYIDDSPITCLNAAYSRLSCIDEEGREWGQPYYAFNPIKGVQKPYIEN